MVGAGIFALLGQAALVAGGETYIAFLIGGFITLVYSRLFLRGLQLATRTPAPSLRISTMLLAPDNWPARYR